MADLNSELFQVWGMRFSIVTTLIVVLLSWINGVRMIDLIVHAGVSFGVMYFLMLGSLSLFEKTAFQEPQNRQPGSASERGGVIDFSVGDDEPQRPLVQDSKLAGQVDPGLSAGLDSERQADIVRRMGWGEEQK